MSEDFSLILTGKISMVDMTTINPIDFDLLWMHIISDFKGGPDSIHGPSHWLRVEKNGLAIAAINGADVTVVRLFAVLHDCRRKNDSFEMMHGKLAADYAATLRGKLFHLDDEQFSLLQEACKKHTHGETSSDPTIGACWDADRLDLGRVGIKSSAKYMSTNAGREMCSVRQTLR